MPFSIPAKRRAALSQSGIVAAALPAQSVLPLLSRLRLPNGQTGVSNHGLACDAAID
jgi:hypothetical protein